MIRGRILIVPIFFCLLMPYAICQTAASSPVSSLLDYDATAPLRIRDMILETFDGGSVHDITYESANERKVNAYLVEPSGKGPFAAILFAHWANGTRAEFLAEAKLYAREGTVSLLTSYSWDLPDGIAPNHFGKPQLDREIEAGAVIDCQRGIDLLLLRRDVDAKRLALVGHSFGAQWAAILTALDKRISTSVMIAGAGEQADILARGNNPALVSLRRSLPANQLVNYSEALSDLDAIRFIGRAAPTPVLMQFGKFDQYIDLTSMHRYATAASPTRLVSSMTRTMRSTTLAR
jgi:dienelactone hydrolase